MSIRIGKAAGCGTDGRVRFKRLFAMERDSAAMVRGGCFSRCGRIFGGDRGGGGRPGAAGEADARRRPAGRVSVSRQFSRSLRAEGPGYQSPGQARLWRAAPWVPVRRDTRARTEREQVGTSWLRSSRAAVHWRIQTQGGGRCAALPWASLGRTFGAKQIPGRMPAGRPTAGCRRHEGCRGGLENGGRAGFIT